MAAYSRTPTISKDGLSTIVDDEPEDGFDDEGSLSLGSLDGVDQSLTQKSSSQSEEYRLNLARDETKQVFRLRLLVFLVLALAATTVCVLVYLVTLQSEEEEYQNQFEGAAAKLTDSFLDVAGSRLGVMASLGVSLTTSVNDNGQQEFPFITMSNFQQRAQPIRSQSGAVYMHFNPFIMEGQRVAWEQFLVGPEGSKWLDEGLAYQDEIGLFAYEEDLHGGGDVSDDPHAGHGSTGHEGQHEMDGTSMHAGGGDGEHSHHQQHAEEMEDTTSAATTVTEDSMNHTGASSGHDHQNMDQTVAPTTQHHHNDGSGMSMATASPQDDTHTGHHDNNMVSTTAPSQEETEETQPQHSMTQEPSSMGHHDHDMPPSSGMTSSGHATTTAPSAIGDGMHEDHTMMMTQEPTTMDYMATMNNGTTHHAMAMNATMSGSMSSPTSSSMNYPDETMQPNGTTDHGMAMNDTMNNTMSSSTSSMNHAGETMLHNGTTHHAMAMNATMQHNHRSLESMDAHAGHDTEDPHAGHQTNEPNAGQDNENSQADLHHDHDVYLALISEESWSIWYHNDKKELVYDEGPGPYMPTYLSSPIFYKGHETNENILQSYGPTGSYKAFSTESVVTSQFLNAPAGNKSSVDPKTALYARLLSANKQAVVAYEGDPFSQVFIPVFDSLEHNKTTVGVLVAWVHWMSFWSNLLPSSLQSIIVVMSDSCQNEYTYAITGTEVSPLGEGDLHDPRFDDMKRFASFEAIDSIQDGTKDGLPFNKDECSISIEVYPSHEFYDTYNTSAPVLFTCSILGIFLFTAIMFVLYDRLVERRQEIVMRKATQTDKIVASLFPENVRDRLLQDTKSDVGNRSSRFLAPSKRVKGFLSGSEDDEIDDSPIADLFPYCTVLFADIAGFTAWSSTRDPSQVFILLQTVYQAFDRVAKRRKVFKVETIGDCYVAVTGLPEPQTNHAIIMSRFAAECNIKMRDLTHRLENTLGPDTAELAMRFGMHSGPVTAGVLRGDRARFQLFGDTVNTAARMESTGIKGRIHCSKSTHDLLVQAGREAWVRPRSDVVQAKGKGVITTFWVHAHAQQGGGSSIGASSRSLTLSKSSHHQPASGSFSVHSSRTRSEKKDRLINWMVEVFREHINKLLAMRGSKSSSPIEYVPSEGKTSLDEVAEVIYLPRFNDYAFDASFQQSSRIDQRAAEQLHQYVSTIASNYHDNPFHNFEHACHVTMACNKFLQRIVRPDIAVNDGQGTDIANKLHEYTHGINSDPLALLAILFSALIHDADHQGISNLQLATENQALAERYRNKSIAEQNSLDLAWDLLMQDRFIDLRNTLFTTKAELKRFRQVLVNVVLATDIFDKELNGLRKARWEKAFSSDTVSEEENNNLRATIVIEHIIQASDVSHTMQHWHVYRKWNRRLFQELYKAFCEGRMSKDPSTFWYNGEIGFFDNYVIPLAKKLKDCQVFGVSSDECLNYALQNRNEWENRGEQIMEEMVSEIKQEVEASRNDAQASLNGAVLKQEQTAANAPVKTKQTVSSKTGVSPEGQSQQKPGSFRPMSAAHPAPSLAPTKVSLSSQTSESGACTPGALPPPPSTSVTQNAIDC